MPGGIARICNAAMARKARFHVPSCVKQTTRLWTVSGMRQEGMPISTYGPLMPVRREPRAFLSHDGREASGSIAGRVSCIGVEHTVETGPRVLERHAPRHQRLTRGATPRDRPPSMTRATRSSAGPMASFSTDPYPSSRPRIGAGRRSE